MHRKPEADDLREREKYEAERKKYEKSCWVRHVAQDGLTVGREAFLD